MSPTKNSCTRKDSTAASKQPAKAGKTIVQPDTLDRTGFTKASVAQALDIPNHQPGKLKTPTKANNKDDDIDDDVDCTSSPSIRNIMSFKTAPRAIVDNVNSLLVLLLSQFCLPSVCLPNFFLLLTLNLLTPLLTPFLFYRLKSRLSWVESISRSLPKSSRMVSSRSPSPTTLNQKRVFYEGSD